MTKFKPILFNTPMVQAILDNRKTKTRRTKGLEQVNENPNDWIFHHVSTDETRTFFHFRKSEPGQTKQIYGTSNFKVGDVLWVRETFIDATMYISASISSRLPTTFCYKANDDFIGCGKWKPSIFMPKAAARIFLKVTTIRVERLQNITRGDAMDEGCPFPNIASENPAGWFLNLWESINGDGSWKLNPFVWVIEFEKIEKPLNFIS